MADEIERVVRQADRQYFGKYRGFVVDNDDPEQLARLRLRIPSILGDVETDWALPCLPYGGLADQGWFAVPEIGARSVPCPVAGSTTKRRSLANLDRPPAA